MRKKQFKLSDFKYLIITSLIVIIYSSCEKEIYYDIPGVSNKIVVNGLVTPGYGIWVNLSKSKHIYSDDNHAFNPVNDEIIAFYEITLVTKDCRPDPSAWRVAAWAG